MFGKEDLIGGVFLGIIVSLAIGAVITFILKPAFSSAVLIISLAAMPGFFIMTLFYVFKMNKEKLSKTAEPGEFDWGIEVNLRRIQIIHARYSSMILVAGVLAMGSFFSMVFLARDFPLWSTGHMIFFPIAMLIFIFSLHFAFRWWFAMREDYQFLRLRMGKRLKKS
jgi:hypothetical protein